MDLLQSPPIIAAGIDKPPHGRTIQLRSVSTKIAALSKLAAPVQTTG
jgi:hypothetical protein